MKPKTQSITATTILSLITLVALILWPMNAEGSIVVLISVAAMSMVWLGIRQMVLKKNHDWINSTTRREILFAIILAGLLLLVSIIGTLFKELDLINNEIAKRSSGVMIGVMLILLGNYMPKKLTHSGGDSCCSTGCSIGESSGTQRLVGWIFVIAGILYAGIWLLVDLEQTSVAVLFTFPAAITILVIARMVYLKASNPNTPAESA